MRNLNEMYYCYCVIITTILFIFKFYNDVCGFWSTVLNDMEH